MNEYTVRSKEVGGYTVNVKIDDDPGAVSPRDWDNLGTIKSFSRHLLDEYTGPKYASVPAADVPAEVLVQCDQWDDDVPMAELDLTQPRHFIAWLQITGAEFLTLYAYVHGGIALSAGTDVLICPWDSGQVGYYFTNQEIIDKFGTPPDRVRACLLGEVEEFAAYLRGEVYGYQVEDEDGEIIDSCWGFIGDSDYCLTEGVAVAEYQIKEDNRRADEINQRLTIAIAKGELPTA